ncbi:hypothetical protein BDZ89DRAFT_1140708 [Hymenopellis radicata]|nr:hypothetical protein BDZ89DRAFT_1140708 [Hymenopellis radicata]
MALRLAWDANTPLSLMQCGAGGCAPAPKWAGSDQCPKLKELELLNPIPFHPQYNSLVRLFSPSCTKKLYFIFESTEGNLYHLIKARKGHARRRDMKPENVLVTATGLFDYNTLAPVAPPNAPPEKDVVAIITLADFGLETAGVASGQIRGEDGAANHFCLAAVKAAQKDIHRKDHPVARIAHIFVTWSTAGLE